jgi:hypothetical protein
MQNQQYENVGAQAVGFLGKARMMIGLMLVTAGVVVFLYPEILQILLAALLLSSGLGSLISGWRMNQRAQAVSHVMDTRRLDE